MTAAMAPASFVPPRPFPGISPYQYQDQAVFFGRAQDAGRLLRMVTIYRGALLYAGQGLGKSSLLNAAFLPMALSEGFLPLRLRVSPEPGREIVAEPIAEREEGKPPYLASIIPFHEQGAERRVLSCSDLRKAVDEWRGPGYPLLLFDQFEEFITLFEEAPKGEARRRAMEAQRSIQSMIIGIWRDHSLRVKLVFAFREDYLAKLHKVFSPIPDSVDVSLRLTPIRTTELEEIIRTPFRRFPGRFQSEISEDLAARLSAALGERSETGEVILSEVQTVCMQLLAATDATHEFEQNGVKGLLERFLESALRTAGPLSGAAVALLNRLVTDEGLRNVISEQNLINAARREDGLPEPSARGALRVLVESQLVRRERREDVVFYSIISEWIVPWIREQKERRRLVTQRANWLRIASALALVALIGIGMAFWVLRYRSERALADEMVAREMVRANQAERAYAALADRHAQLKQNMQHRQEEHATTLAALEAARTQLDGQLAAQSKRLRQEQSAAATLSAEVTQSRNQLASVSREYNQLKASHSRLAAEAAELNGSLAESHQIIEDLNAKLARAPTPQPNQPPTPVYLSLPICPAFEVGRLTTGWVRTIRVAQANYYLYVRDITFSDVWKLYLFSTGKPWWKGAKFKNELDVEKYLKKADVVTKGTFAAYNLDEGNTVRIPIEGNQTLVLRNLDASGGSDEVAFTVCLAN